LIQLLELSIHLLQTLGVREVFCYFLYY